MSDPGAGDGPDDDHELVTALRRGDDAAFVGLVRTLSGGMLRMPTHYVVLVGG